ncbi:hypothetical protein Ciccas_010576 [Cichlidogyrus casuarinus]|uniref:Uncharacterized protein n=1 Tax=Cichlidogyrus casuarinus TaxID=1844966 RepID=A0ABD2PVD6_9PLAT
MRLTHSRSVLYKGYYNFANKDFADLMMMGDYTDGILKNKSSEWDFIPENVAIVRNPVTSG